MENTVVNISEPISDRDDIIRNFDWREILTPDMLSYSFIPTNENSDTFEYCIKNKHVAKISAYGKTICVHPCLNPEQVESLIQDLRWAVTVFYRFQFDVKVDINNDLTAFTVSFYGSMNSDPHLQPKQAIKAEQEKNKINMDIVYVELPHGLIFKIVRKEMKGYRFNPEKKEWNYDGPVYCEYAYGELGGKIIDFEDHYPIGEPFVYQKNK